MNSQPAIHDNLPDIYKNLDVTKNKSRPIMTKYEYTLIRGLRLQQLNENNVPYVDIKELKEKKICTIENIFEMEFNAGKLPFIISRPIGHHVEYWRVADLYYGDIIENFLDKGK